MDIIFKIDNAKTMDDLDSIDIPVHLLKRKCIKEGNMDKGFKQKVAASFKDLVAVKQTLKNLEEAMLKMEGQQWQ